MIAIASIESPLALCSGVERVVLEIRTRGFLCTAFPGQAGLR